MKAKYDKKCSIYSLKIASLVVSLSLKDLLVGGSDYDNLNQTRMEFEVVKDD